MAFTTQWEWANIDRRRDFSVVRFIETFRENWTLTRSRISDEPYVSALGDTSTALIGYNGGVTETISAPSGYVTGEFEELAGDSGYPYTQNIPFFKQSYKRNGKDVYLYTEPSPNNPDYYAVIFYEPLTLDISGFTTEYYWWWVEVTPEDALSGAFPTAFYTYYTDPDASLLAGLQRGTAQDTPFADNDWAEVSISSTSFSFTQGNAALSFRCIADSQVYNQSHVDWFSQTQTWVLKTPWGI